MCKKAVKRLIVMLAAVCMMFTMSMPGAGIRADRRFRLRKFRSNRNYRRSGEWNLQVMLAYVDDGETGLTSQEVHAFLSMKNMY